MTEQQSETTEEPVLYIGFWARFIAFLVDSIAASLILAPLATKVAAHPATRIDARVVLVRSMGSLTDQFRCRVRDAHRVRSWRRPTAWSRIESWTCAQGAVVGPQLTARCW